MGLFRTPEEREAEQRERAEQERRQAEEARLAEEERRRAAFAASPIGRARAAHARGDRFFQVELDAGALTGYASVFGSSDNEIRAHHDESDLLGRIEDEGWRLEHTGFVFIETGSTSTERMFFSGEGTVTRGVVTGIYLFRRVDRG